MMKNPLFSPAERAFYSHVLAHLRNFSNVIDVTKFANAQHWSMQKIMELYVEVLWDSPEVFYVSKCVQCSWEEYSDGTMRFAKLTNIQYAFPQEEYQQNKVRLDAEVKKAVIYAARESSPEMIALRLHDYIVQTCEYDTHAADTGDLSPLSRTAYSVLVRKKAVCEGYTMAYRYLLQKFNIRSEEIWSEEMMHCWNYVCIRGRWYHVDVTYDDPVFVDGTGGLLTKGLNILTGNSDISRKYFLMSDAKARRGQHRNWTTKGLPPATDTFYDNKHWG